MVVAIAVSRLVDPADKVMNFDSEEMESEQTQKMLGLVKVCDRIATIEDLRDMRNAEDVRVIREPSEEARQHRKAPTRTKEQPTQSSKIIAIEEVDDEEDEEEDLIPYAKPDEDPSDSDEDPTLINRSKPSAPVYIVDLIKQLQTNDKPEIIELALRTAPDLIRRKANFGTELSDNVQAVASSILNLKDGMSNPDFQQSRLHSLIACLVSKPATIGPWLASMYFEGDFSLAQRATILTTIGLSSRELSGHHDSSIFVDAVPFPSKQLPPHLAAIYSPTNSIAREIEHFTLQPLALAAADKLSGPDVLKVRTFSSRLEVERKKEAKKTERSRRISKDLHALLAESLYLPLCCRMSLLLTSSVNTTRSVIFEANIIRLFLQTLTIILHSLGPNAVQLETVTRETLLLLVALHNTPTLAYDAVLLPALLQLLLTTLDLNVEAGRTAEERFVTDFGVMMAELITWAGGLAEGGISVPVLEGEGLGMPWTVLVAGIQVKWHEVGRKFQGRMLGLMSGELDGF
jgi:telomere length regulation protein